MVSLRQHGLRSGVSLNRPSVSRGSDTQDSSTDSCFVAVIVGCGPGLYRKARAVATSRQQYYYDNKGYIKTGSSKAKAGVVNSKNGDTIQMKTWPATTVVETRGIGGSQEELVRDVEAGRIQVTQSFNVSRLEQGRD
jgi:hypothetical protein